MLAAEHNTEILSKHNFNLEAMFSHTIKNTHLQMGSEFRPTSDLEPLLCTYPLWTRIKSLFNKGVEIPLIPMDINDEIADNKATMQRGNHKGATSQPTLLNKLVTKDIEHAFALPILPSAILKIKGGRLAPLNIASQWTINEHGEKIKKKRLTHDQSFQGLVSGQSLNEQVITDELEPIIYGHMFLRICHMIHAMRFAYPAVHILMFKIDLDSAFRRLHLSAAAAAKCICATTICAVIYLRLTFGSSFSPAEWCIVIETITDLALDIANNPLWCHNTTVTSWLKSSDIPKPILLPNNIPFAPALPCDVSVLLPRYGHFDSFVDDIIGICLHIGNNATKTVNAILLSIHLLARPFTIMATQIIPHNYIISAKKWLAEGTQEETKTILGWLVDSRRLIVQLPPDKYKAYSEQVKATIKAGKIDHKQLENIIGRLQRASYVAPHSKYFLNRLRMLCRITTKTNWANLPAPVLQDLTLWLEFLKQGSEGTSINNIIFRAPSTFHWADSCPFGLGGYSASGRAWRLYIPPHLRTGPTNNVLEYMASIITTWIEIYEDRIPPLSCCLSLSDSTSTVGWLHRATFDSAIRPVHEECSRHIARLMIQTNSTIYSQHQKGKHNTIADLLSRWHFLTDIELLTFLRSTFPSQLPTHFWISPVPKEIISWTISMLQKLQTTAASRSPPTMTKVERGNDSSPGWKRWAGTTTPSLLGLRELRRPEWLALLPSLSAEGNTVMKDTRDHWLLGRSARPCQTWLRPFKTTITAISDTTAMAKPTDLSLASSAPSRKSIQKKRPRKQ